MADDKKLIIINNDIVFIYHINCCFVNVTLNITNTSYLPVLETRDVRVLRLCAHRIFRRIGHPVQNVGSCAELRKIYQMAQKMRKFC